MAHHHRPSPSTTSALARVAEASQSKPSTLTRMATWTLYVHVHRHTVQLRIVIPASAVTDAVYLRSADRSVPDVGGRRRVPELGVPEGAVQQHWELTVHALQPWSVRVTAGTEHIIVHRTVPPGPIWRALRHVEHVR